MRYIVEITTVEGNEPTVDEVESALLGALVNEQLRVSVGDNISVMAHPLDRMDQIKRRHV